MGWSRFLLLIGITSLVSIPAGALKCFACKTTWDMGCWYKWKGPKENGVDPKHLQGCGERPNVTHLACIKETFQDAYFSKNDIHGYSPYVHRRCGRLEEEATGVIIENGCQKSRVRLIVENKTMLSIERTICSCSTDGCNVATGLNLKRIAGSKPVYIFFLISTRLVILVAL